MLWSDEFDGAELDLQTWTAEHWAPGHVNNEDQEYGNDEKNLRVEDGVLIVEAHYQGPERPAYSSARVHSAAQQNMLYGRVDIRARLPEGRGLLFLVWDRNFIFTL